MRIEGTKFPSRSPLPPMPLNGARHHFFWQEAGAASLRPFQPFSATLFSSLILICHLSPYLSLYISLTLSQRMAYGRTRTLTFHPRHAPFRETQKVLFGKGVARWRSGHGSGGMCNVRGHVVASRHGTTVTGHAHCHLKVP